MSQSTLQAEARSTGTRESRRARHAGLVPAVVYGPDIDPLALSVRRSDLKRVMERSGRGQVVHLHVAGEPRPRPVLLKDTQWHSLLQRVEHADFLQVDMDRDTRIMLPVVLQGEEVLRKQRLVVSQQLSEAEVEGRPADLPPVITLDISGVTDPGAITAASLVLPAGIALVTDPAAVVCSVTIPSVQAAQEPEAAETEGAAETPLEPAAEE